MAELPEEQFRAVAAAYEVLHHEWRHMMRRPDVPAGWLVDLHARLCGPEFTGSGDDRIEAWRLGAVIEVEARVEQVAPGYLAAVTPER